MFCTVTEESNGYREGRFKISKKTRDIIASEIKRQQEHMIDKNFVAMSKQLQFLYFSLPLIQKAMGLNSNLQDYFHDPIQQKHGDHLNQRKSISIEENNTMNSYTHDFVHGIGTIQAIMNNVKAELPQVTETIKYSFCKNQNQLYNIDA